MTRVASSPYLSVELSQPCPGTIVATLIGELDISNCALLDALLLPLPSEGAEHVIVCVERLTFCDVLGFRVLKNMDLIMRATGIRLSIVAPSPQLLRLMTLLEGGPMSTWPAMRRHGSLAEAWRARSAENGLTWPSA
jgi:anti-anti-sigma factor